MNRLPIWLLIALVLAMPISLLAGRLWLDPFSELSPNALAILIDLR